MKHQLKEEIKDNLGPNTTQETSKTILEFDVINIKKEEDKANLESNVATTFDRVAEHDSEKQSSKIKSAAIEKHHQCEHCDKKFMERYLLINHTRVHTGEKPFECLKCGKKYARKDAMRRHMLTHMKKIKKPISLGPISCEICHKSFGAASALKLHMNIHTRENVFKCSECNEEFLQKHGLKRHWLRIHKKAKLKPITLEPISCEICHKSFRGASALNLHMNIHTREKFFKCYECNEEFLRKSGLKRHRLRVHKNEKLKIISCEICDKSFGRTDTLKLHMNIHTREKVFKCSECNKEFTQKYGLKRHWLRIHKKEKLKAAIEKTYRCEHCDKEFLERYMLINHTRVHTGEKPFECSKCGKRFTLKICLKVHMQTHMKKIKKPFSCEICHRRFGRSSTLKLHINTHTREKVFKCSECNKEFLWINNFKRHLLHVHKKEKSKAAAIEKPHKCEHCGKKFLHRRNLIIHTRVHTGERPFQCSKCDKKYASKPTMKAHMQTHMSKIKKEIPHSNSGEISMLSTDDSTGGIKSEFKNIKAEKIDVIEIAITECTDTEEKVKPALDEKGSSHLPYNSGFGETICKEEVILPDEIEFELKNIEVTEATQ